MFTVIRHWKEATACVHCRSTLVRMYANTNRTQYSLYNVTDTNIIH